MSTTVRARVEFDRRDRWYVVDKGGAPMSVGFPDRSAAQAELESIRAGLRERLTVLGVGEERSTVLLAGFAVRYTRIAALSSVIAPAQPG